MANDSTSVELQIPNRFITTFNEKGLGVFDDTIPVPLPTEVDGNLAFHFGYATTTFPVDLSNNADLKIYTSLLSSPPGITLPGGTILRVVDIQPGGETPMHRTVSLDYGVVLDGEIELLLDSGESRVLKKGDISIQRGTSHLWRNKSQDAWGRMLFVGQDIKPVEMNGGVLDSNYGMDK